MLIIVGMSQRNKIRTTVRRQSTAHDGFPQCGAAWLRGTLRPNMKLSLERVEGLLALCVLLPETDPVRIEVEPMLRSARLRLAGRPSLKLCPPVEPEQGSARVSRRAAR